MSLSALKRYLLCTLGTVLSVVVFGQQNTAKLRENLSTAISDSAKVAGYEALFTYYRHSYPDSAKASAESAMAFSSSVNYIAGTAKASGLMAVLQEDAGKMDLAMKWYNDAAGLYERCGNRVQVARAMNHIGIVYGKKGNFDTAVKIFYNSLAVLEAAKDTVAMAETYVSLGTAYQLNDNLDFALKFYEKGRELLSHRPTIVLTAVASNDIGIIYARRGNFEEALEYFLNGLKLCGADGYTEIRSLLQLNCGNAYLSNGNKSKAMEYLVPELAFARANHLPEHEARTLEVMAEAEPANSLQFIAQALELTREEGLIDLRIGLYTDLVDFYKRKKDFEKALDVSDIRERLIDSNRTVKRNRELAELQMTYELDKSNRRIADLKNLIHKNTQKRDIIVVISLVTLVVLIILAFSYSKTMRLNKSLVKRTEQLTQANTVKDKLFSIIGHDLRGPMGNIPVLLELYDDSSTPQEERQYLYDSVKELALSCKDTLDKLLYWGKSNFKGITINRVAFKPKENIETCFRLIRSAAGQKNIVLMNHVAEHTTILADVEHFEFLMRNLLSNAVKFSYPNKTINVAADVKSQPGFVVFSVQDEGVPIPAEVLPRLFDGSAMGTEGTANEKGTNIGLQLCREFVSENGGAIWAENTGAGATFYFSLKVA